MTTTQKYALVTPARNEEANIEKTILSVTSQTVLPQRWVIVSDGSTDRTDEIVRPYADEHDFITFVRATDQLGGKVSFGSKVRAFNAGHERLAGVDYDFVGNLDGDVSFEPDYFERVLAELNRDPKLGLTGGVILEMIKGHPVPRNTSENSVAGAIQLFRRTCFEAIGGFTPIDRGGEDTAAEIMARMKGWHVRHQGDLRVVHHGRVLGGCKSPLAARYNKGVLNKMLGYHPLFQLAVCARHMASRPWIIGGLWMLVGYSNAMVRQTPRILPDDVVNYLRAEQLARLRLRRPANG